MGNGLRHGGVWNSPFVSRASEVYAEMPLNLVLFNRISYLFL